jgi:polyvinyl alcohol dehydrogenase (cytochrome)
VQETRSKIDARRKLLYVGTGNNKTRATTTQSDSVLALDLETGRVAWAFQAVAGDAWNGGCGPSLAQGNCPRSPGPDSDFGAPPVLVTAGGRELLLAGEVRRRLRARPSRTASGETRVGRGGTSGGVHFGMAAGDGALYVPIYDDGDGRVDGWAARPGLYALEAATGRLRWARGQAELCAGDTDCFAGVSAPVTAIPGAVFAASIDGTTRAFDARDGRVLWSFDAVRRFPSLAGGTAQGGGLASAGGPVVANGRLFLGAGHAWTKRGGDALLVFAPAGAAPQLSGVEREPGR